MHIRLSRHVTEKPEPGWLPEASEEASRIPSQVSASRRDVPQQRHVSALLGLTFVFPHLRPDSSPSTRVTVLTPAEGLRTAVRGSPQASRSGGASDASSGEPAALHGAGCAGSHRCLGMTGFGVQLFMPSQGSSGVPRCPPGPKRFSLRSRECNDSLVMKSLAKVSHECEESGETCKNGQRSHIIDRVCV